MWLLFPHAVGPAAAQGIDTRSPGGGAEAPAPPPGGLLRDPLPERRGGGAPDLPPVELAPPPGAPPVPPPPASPPAREPLAPATTAPDGPRFLLRGVRLAGSTVLDQAAIDQAAAPFLGRPVGIAELEELRRRITLLYVERGYVNSGALIPDQTVADGILVLQAVEGRLTAIELTGQSSYRASYIEDRLRRGIGVPFNVNDLARQQQILLQDPFLRRLNLDIQPGLAPGEARLASVVTEAPPYALTLQVANNQSPTVGGVRGQIQGVVGNLLGVGDILAVQYGRSDRLDDGAISYSVPLAADDTRLNPRYDINSTLVVARSLAPLDITGRYDSIAIGLTRPFWRTPEETFTLGLSLERRRSESYLLGEPFSFVVGAENGRTNVTALRFSQDWLDRNAERVVALRSTFSFGIDAFGATVTRERPSG
jgi:hemolysin activation/secretion protein